MSGFKKINENQRLVGRQAEMQWLENIEKKKEASIIIMYGRRRVGKTELLEQTFRERRILKFEGVEGKDQDEQRALVMRQLGQYADNPLLKKVVAENWLDVFEAIYHYAKKGIWTIYFEEVQWLANYHSEFVSELKTVWDNYFRHNPNIILILCGSSPSFMIKKVLHSKSLYNRSQYEIQLKPFSIQESKAFLKSKSNREVMNAYLTVGGMPEYLKKIKSYSSVFTGVCQESFLPHSYFSQEYQRIFVSSLVDSPHYQKIIQLLSQQRFATREAISEYLNLNSGGRLTGHLEELELCGFIKKYVPYHLGDNSKLARYEIADEYLQFFFKFIQPQLKAIDSGRYQDQATSALKLNIYQQWLGYAFERYCRNHAHDIAKLLGFSGVNYQSGVFYNRATNQEQAGYQIDLLFDRDDHVITICEIKYLQSKVGTKIIEEFEKKLELFPNKKNKTIHKVLISAEGIDQALETRHYFDNVIVLDDLFSA